MIVNRNHKIFADKKGDTTNCKLNSLSMLDTTYIVISKILYLMTFVCGNDAGCPPKAYSYAEIKSEGLHHRQLPIKLRFGDKPLLSAL